MRDAPASPTPPPQPEPDAAGAGRADDPVRLAARRIRSVD